MAEATSGPATTTPTPTPTPKTQQPKPVGTSNNQTSLGVEDVIMRTITSYGLGGTYLDNEVYVLFENGEIYNNPKDSPRNLDRANFKREKPKGWGTWKKQGSKLVTTYPGKGKTYEWDKWFRIRPATDGFKIDGKFESLDPFGGAVVVNSNIVSFNKQGQFAWKSLAGGQTAWLPVYSKKSTSGTYEIKDYSIVLIYNDGQKEELFFGRYPKSEKHFIIGVGHFVPLDE